MAAWFSRLFTGQEGRDGALAINQQALLAGWRQLPEVDISRSHYRSRYVLVDVETAARSLKSDRLVSIAALALVDGLIDFQEAFHVVLAHDAPGADAAAGEASEANAPTAPNPALVIAGVPPVDALISFPVPYTHLDVYKRQAAGRAALDRWLSAARHREHEVALRPEAG